MSGRRGKNGHDRTGEFKEARRRLSELISRFDSRIKSINDLGCELKDLEIGLFDFRTSWQGQDCAPMLEGGRTGDRVLARVGGGFRGPATTLAREPVWITERWICRRGIAKAPDGVHYPTRCLVRAS